MKHTKVPTRGGIVLDVHGLLAYLRAEDAGARVKELLQQASRADRHLHMTEADYAELKFQVLTHEGPAAWDSVSRLLVALPLEFHPVTRDLADAAADLRAKHRLNTTASFAAALARERKAELATIGSEFGPLQGEIRLQHTL